MKTTDDIQNQLSLLYALQKEQEFQLTAGISKLSSVFTPVHIISEILGTVIKQEPDKDHKEAVNYSPLWDKLTNQIGITSPLAKSTIHIALDQLMSKWLDEKKPQQKEGKTLQKEAVLDHSLHHF